jgi:hypothetical protein
MRFLEKYKGIRDNLVGKTCYWLHEEGSIYDREIYFFLPYIFETISWVHPTSFQMGITGSFTGGKAAWA